MAHRIEPDTSPGDDDVLTATDGTSSWTLVRPRDQPAQRRKRMAEHVLYEFEACSATASLLATDGRSSFRDFAEYSKPWWAGNAYLEAFLVHVRSLDEFFYKDSIEAAKGSPLPIIFYDTDVTALTFVRDQPLWLRDRPPRPDRLQRFYRRINKTIHHLSWQRLSTRLDDDHNAFAKGQDWSYWEVWDALKPTIRTFLPHADNASLCDGFRFRTERALLEKSVVE